MMMGENQIDAYYRDKTSSSAPTNYAKRDLYLQYFSGARVLIGKINDSTNAKLLVDGKIKAEELLIDTVTGADFVFEDDYDLMSLDEVETFVEKNNHLPGVESAKSMQKNGLEMGEFQIKLLQKVEELTLYAIEQKNQIKKLEAALDDAGIEMRKGPRQ